MTYFCICTECGELFDRDEDIYEYARRMNFDFDEYDYAEYCEGMCVDCAETHMYWLINNHE